MIKNFNHVLCASGMMFLAACSGNGFLSSSKPDRNQSSSDQAAAESALKDGINLYDSGNYNGALKRLSAVGKYPKIDTEVQVSALKYMAFSYCVTARQILCKQQFQRAFALDPAFNLAYGEIGHPLWNSTFEQAKREKH